MNHFPATAIAAIALGLPTMALATPPIWDPDFGTNTGLAADDFQVSKGLGFTFPLLGGTYNSVSIGTNGGVVLGNNGAYAGTDSVGRDIWQDNYTGVTDSSFEDKFTNALAPRILVFNTDLDNDQGSQGDIFFKSDGASATITWSEMATNKTPNEAFLTFQLRLDVDGTIVMGYLSPQGDLITDMSEGIVVGVSDGGGSSPPGSLDLSGGGDSGSSPHAYEIWCFDGGGNCFEPAQPDNTAFDLAQDNLVFTANGSGGWSVSSDAGSGGSGGGGGGATGPLLLVTVLALLACKSRRDAIGG